MELGIKTKQLCFGVICLNDIIPGGLWFVQMQFCEHQLCFIVISRQKRLSCGFRINHTCIVPLVVLSCSERSYCQALLVALGFTCNFSGLCMT